MKLTPLSEIMPGMRVGKSLIDIDGKALLQAGITITDRYLLRLQERGYTAVYIAENFSDVEMPDLISDATRKQVMTCMSEFLSQGIIKPGPGDLADTPASTVGLTEKMARAADVLVSEVLSSPDVIIGLVDLKSMMDVSFAHSVQVALVSIIVARSMGFGREKLRQLGVGALLHDIGKTTVPAFIWDKKGRLTSEEFGQAKGHAAAGFDILMGAKTGLLESHVAFQHHERWDGSGYPRGLDGKSISLYARICGVCDVFDAMISDRPYKKALHPYEALEFITQHSGVLFDPEIVRCLSSVVAPYPMATNVRLSNGDYAVVRKLNPHNLLKPVVVVTKNSRGEYYPELREIDLSADSSVTIAGFDSWTEDQSVKQGRH